MFLKLKALVSRSVTNHCVYYVNMTTSQATWVLVLQQVTFKLCLSHTNILTAALDLN